MNHGFQIGDTVLRKNHNYPDEPDAWIKTTMNSTYMELADESPQDFRTLEGGRYVKSRVECDVCSHVWDAIHVEGTERLQCPNCKQMAYAIQLNTTS